MREIFYKRGGIVALLVGALALGAATPATAQTDDSALFSVAVAPNVLLVLDNSGSMNHIVWHPAYDPAKTSSCTSATGGYGSGTQYYKWPASSTKCGNKRYYIPDPTVTAAGNSTRFDRHYLNWIHSLDASNPVENQILVEIGALNGVAITNDGTYSSCLQGFGYTTYSKYRRARVTAAKDVLREVICNVNQAGEVRFGLAQFRKSGGSGDPNGGFVRVPIRDFDATTYSLNGTSATHLDHLGDAIDAIEGETWTPIGETLFQLYTYFMSRNTADRMKGLNGSTFPKYTYRTNVSGNYGSYTTTASSIPGDPVQYACQKNFVVLITDGEPTKDDFDNSNSSDNTAQGFSSFGGLIGDYHVDGETEVGGTNCVGGSECALYLDDIAKYMTENDFRPIDGDKTGVQTIDTYTVGFTTSPAANALLSAAAVAGNGLFFHSNNAEDLVVALVATMTDIVQKSQSFTAATVPATRTSAGGNFYTSLFIPDANSPYWEGHLKLFDFTAHGDILDKNGNCALLNPSPPGECKSGQIAPSAVPFWDAGAEIPGPLSRNLLTSLPTAPPIRVDFTTALPSTIALGDVFDATDDLTIGDKGLYAGSIATSAEELGDEIIQNVRGCEFGTGVTAACIARPWRLADIFHSNPLVVSGPRAFVQDASYTAFKALYKTRDKVVYSGANGGFLHAFHAGAWQANPPSPATPGYDRGTGDELFGFMPWPARQNIRNLPKDTGTRDFYFVDGSPAAADVWIYSSPSQTVKALDGSEWKTILMGGLRQGGRAYYALDITDPSSSSYPEYLWEFPTEAAPATLKRYFGETWGQPILTKVKVKVSGVSVERWVAVMTGGYAPESDPNDPLNYDATAYAGRGIFIVDLENGEILAEKKFNPAASAGDPEGEMLYAMAATPAVLDLDGDGFSDLIYIGDLGGNLWKWVIAEDAGANHYGTDPINSTGDVSQPNWPFRRFFQTTDTASSALGVTVNGVDYYKSLFFSPAVTRKSGKLWLAFGSGERANLKRPGDSSTTDENNRFYSVQDLDPLERKAPLGGHPVVSEADLFDVTSDGTCANLAGYLGYFFKGRESEKWVTNVDIFSYQVIAASFTPTASTDPCLGGGSATLYLFKVYCGEGFWPGATGPERRMELGAGMPTDPKVSVSPEGTRVIVTQQDGEIENPPGPPPPGDGLGQLYWREVNQ